MPAHIHHYHNIPQERIRFMKLVWPGNSLDLNPIESIWTEVRDKVHDHIGPWMRVVTSAKFLSSYVFLQFHSCNFVSTL